MKLPDGINRRAFLGKIGAAAAAAHLAARGEGGTPTPPSRPRVFGLNSSGILEPVAADALAAGVLPPGAELANGTPAPAFTGGITGQPNILIIMVDQLRQPLWLPPGMSASEFQEAAYPNINSLGNQSFSFTNFFTAATNCTPARAAILTGLYSQQQCMFLAHSSKSAPSLNTGFPTFATALSDSLGTGWLVEPLVPYDTAWNGKWHLSSPSSVEPYGFGNANSFPWTNDLSPDGFANEGNTGGNQSQTYPELINDYQIYSEKFVAWANAKVTENPTAPWLSVVSFINPHDIANAPGTFTGMEESPDFQWPTCHNEVGYQCVFPPSGGSPWFAPPSTSGGPTTGPNPNPYPGLSVTPLFSGTAPVSPSNASWNGWDPAVSKGYVNGSAMYPAKPDLQESFYNYLFGGLGQLVPYTTQQAEWLAGWTTFLNYYYWMANCVDAWVGNANTANSVIGSLSLEYPNGTTLGDNTIVIFLADHGEYAGSHTLHDKGASVYDESINVPLYVSFPSQRGKQTSPIYRSQMVSSVDLMPFLLTEASGSQTWRTETSGPWTYLAGRESISDFIYLNVANARRLVTVDKVTLPYILHTYDENAPDKYIPRTYPTALPYHVIGLRTQVLVEQGGPCYGGKIATYSMWPSCSTQLTPSTIQWEYYDYSSQTATPGNTSELGNDYFTSPNFSAYQPLIDPGSGSDVLVNQLYALPSSGSLKISLSTAHTQALAAYFAAVGQNCS